MILLENLSLVQEVMRSSETAGRYHVLQTRHDELQHGIEEGYLFIVYGDDMVIFAEKVGEEGRVLASSNQG